MNSLDIAHLAVEAGILRNVWHLPQDKWFVNGQNKISPAYWDFKRLLGYPAVRQTITEQLAQVVKVEFADCPPDAMSGVMTSGASWGTSIADRLGLGFVYPRIEQKDHGVLDAPVEGINPDITTAVLVDDALMSGSTLRMGAERHAQAGLTTLGALVIVNLGPPVAQITQPDGTVKAMNVHCLFSAQDMVCAAVIQGQIDTDQAERLHTYYNDPTTQPWN